MASAGHRDVGESSIVGFTIRGPQGQVLAPDTSERAVKRTSERAERFLLVAGLPATRAGRADWVSSLLGSLLL